MSERGVDGKLLCVIVRQRPAGTTHISVESGLTLIANQ